MNFFYWFGLILAFSVGNAIFDEQAKHNTKRVLEMWVVPKREYLRTVTPHYVFCKPLTLIVICVLMIAMQC